MFPLSAIVMLVFGCFVLYGGLLCCIYVAIKKNKRKD